MREGSVARSQRPQLRASCPSESVTDLFSAIAQGGDVEELASKADEQMNGQLNG